jgi:hypothetical protein
MTLIIKDPHGRFAVCSCCHLRQPVCLDVTGVTARTCSTCIDHQGQDLARRAARAESHERMLRERLQACRSSELRAQDEATKARNVTKAALRSRGLLACRLVEAFERAHNHRCTAQAIACDADVTEWARRERERRW